MSPAGNASPKTSLKRIRSVLTPEDHRVWVALAMALASLFFLSTLQVEVNGSRNPYATDVGEIQNALPRWGLIHRSGYPLYTAIGSLFVTLLRMVGIQPAAGASLYSALWGAVAVGLLVVLAQELGTSGPPATVGALAAALSASVWVYASLAEVHTLTLVLSIATLIMAISFGRTGTRRDLLLLVLAFSQGVAHQRSVVLLAPAVLVLIWPQLGTVWENLPGTVAVALLAFLVYLYMPFRVWTGANWVFGSPGTWNGFWTMLFDNRAGRAFHWPSGLGEWSAKAGVTLQLLSEDMPWLLLALGLLGLFFLAVKRKREGLAMILALLPNVFLTLIIWEGRISDAELAAKLPALVLVGSGLALILEEIRQRSRLTGLVVVTLLLVALGAWGWRTRSFVLSITRDPAAKAVVATVREMGLPIGDRPITLAVPWGHDYWALTYAQAYQGTFPYLTLVDHNANFRAIVGRGDRLLVLSDTFYVMPVSWWEERLGSLYLASVSPGIIEISPTPIIRASDKWPDVAFDLDSGLGIRSATLEWIASNRLLLTIYWEVDQPVVQDYSVAIHLVAHDPPRDGADILAQADSANPLEGWYPTSHWRTGEIVRDNYALQMPKGAAPVAVRVTLYRTDPVVGFVNSPWLSLPLPSR